MSVDKSLKMRMGALKNRNVLTRGERIAKLQETDRWGSSSSVLGLPKVRVQKLSLKKKKKVKAEEAEGETAAAAAPAGDKAGEKKPDAKAGAKK